MSGLFYSLGLVYRHCITEQLLYSRVRQAHAKSITLDFQTTAACHKEMPTEDQATVTIENTRKNPLGK